MADTQAVLESYASRERRAGVSVTKELLPRFVPRYTIAEVAESVRDALHELRGSVSGEALPEMAARLASHRLGGDHATTRRDFGSDVTGAVPLLRPMIGR